MVHWYRKRQFIGCSDWGCTYFPTPSSFETSYWLRRTTLLVSKSHCLVLSTARVVLPCGVGVIDAVFLLSSHNVHTTTRELKMCSGEGRAAAHVIHHIVLVQLCSS